MFIVKKFTQRELTSQLLALPLPAGAGGDMGNGEPIAVAVMRKLAGLLAERGRLEPSVRQAIGRTCAAEVRFLRKLSEPERGILDFYKDEAGRVADFVDFMADLWGSVLKDAPLSATSSGVFTYRLKLIGLLPAIDVVQGAVVKALKRSVEERVDLGGGMAATVADNMTKLANLPKDDVKLTKLVWPKDLEDTRDVDMVRQFLGGTELGTWLLSNTLVNTARRVIEVKPG